MSFNYINKFLLILTFIFILSCQDTLINKQVNSNNKNYDKNYNIETKEKLDKKLYQLKKNNIIDYYTLEKINIDFTNRKAHKIKLKGKKNISNSLNFIYDKLNIYSIGIDGIIYKYDSSTYELIEKIEIDIPTIKNKTPTSFSMFNNNFVISFY